jgi:cytosine permease
MDQYPDYISRAVPNPSQNRAPWYANTAPSYAGIFLWIVFYQALGGQTIRHAGWGICLAALVVAGLLCHLLYYFVPAMLGMKTGYPLYVVGSSTFGTAGGYVMPGLLMGLLQIGWFAVGSFIATDFILKGLRIAAVPGSIPFIVVGVIWGYAMAYVGVKGIRYVGKVSLLLNCIPLVMLVVVFFQTAAGIGHYHPKPTETDNYGAFTVLVAIVLGFFATGGAAGADFGMNSRNAKDVKWGGLVGIALATVFAGGLSLLSVAGAHGLNPGLTGYQYDDVVREIGGPVATAMFFLFALASIPPACFCSFIIGNSFSTMIPQVSRLSSTMAGATGPVGNRRSQRSHRVLRHRWRIVQSDLWRYRRGLSLKRPEVGGTKTRNKLGWIRSLGRGIFGWDSTGSANLAGNEKLFSTCTFVQLHSGLRRISRSREGRSGAS